ncbi:MAG TPA: HAD hydrolase family protein [Verrucomicrobiae bacterium]|nr:HAD hydrolase family protein [Verrucomicrobiae bacterium]
MTDNRVLVMDHGQEAVFCNRSDGMAFSMFRQAKIPALILSTEKNPVVAARGLKLQVPVLQNIPDKAAALREYCSQLGVDLQDVLYAGNDLNDFAAMSLVGMPVCPVDAHPRIQEISRVVLRSAGGAGVAREVAEDLLGLDYVSLGKATGSGVPK